MINKLMMGKYILLIAFLVLSTTKSQHTNVQYNPIIPDYIADPSLVMFDSVFYMYATTDINQGLHKMGIPVVWISRDFVNWHFEGTIIPQVDWNKPYEFTDKEGKTKTGYFRYWAPGKVLKKGDKYYLFPTIVTPDEKMGTYVMVSDDPEGPFLFTNGKGLFFNDPENEKYMTKPLIDDIDGEPFIDDGGKAYIYWRRRNASALSDDYMNLAGEKINIPTSFGGYSEGPVLFKRNNIYYYIYTLSGHANYCNGYMISNESPLGPFTKPDGDEVFIYSDVSKNVWGPGHGNVFQLPGTDNFYFLYLEYGEGGTTRQVFANKIAFNDDGTMKHMMLNREGIGFIPGKEINKQNKAMGSNIEASSFKESKIVKTQIISNPNLLPEKRIHTRSGDSVKRSFTYLPENVADGSNGTHWAAAKTDPAPWIMFDLKKNINISRCEIAFVFPTIGHSYTLETSTDGKKWKGVKKTGVPEIKSPHVIHNLGKARFVKINITGGYGGIWEVKMY